MIGWGQWKVRVGDRTTVQPCKQGAGHLVCDFGAQESKQSQAPAAGVQAIVLTQPLFRCLHEEHLLMVAI